MLVEVRSGIDGYYWEEVGMNSAAWRIKPNCEMYYIQG